MSDLHIPARRWRVASNGSTVRHWYVYNYSETGRQVLDTTPSGRYRTFQHPQNAQRRADVLNMTNRKD